MRHLMFCFPLQILLVLLAVCSVAAAREPAAKKLQVFILAGQSNMVGHANGIILPRILADERPEVRALGDLVFKAGTMTPEKAESLIAPRIARDKIYNDIRLKKITDEGEIAAAKATMKKMEAEYNAEAETIQRTYATSARVFVSSIADGNLRSGPLTVGFGGNNQKLGPELGFGMSLAKRIKSPILIIKTSWGGKSLNYDFRPPSAVPFKLSEKQQASPKAEEIRQNSGRYYRLMLTKVKEVLGDLKKQHPQYDPSVGYDLAGFVWFQGFNDQFSPEFRDNYKDLMVTFIKDVRKEFSVPKMPFVIGVLGTGITEEAVGENAVSLGQRAAGQAAEFKGNVVAVESYKVYDLSAYAVYKQGWQHHFGQWCAVGSDRPYHYLGSAKFFVRLGDSFANAMEELIKNQE